MGNGRIFLTGAYGNVGANTIKHLSKQGYEIICFDLRSNANETVARKLLRQHKFKMEWGNLRDQQSVDRAITKSEPDAILHLASVIAPMAYVLPEIAEDVNVNGTRYLIEAAQKLKRPPKFVNVSSYTVHGNRNPYKNLPPISEKTPINPVDNYCRQKVKAEQMVAASGLDWTTIRLPAVQATDAGWGRHPAFMRYGFLLSLEHKMHALDSRDAALALTNAIAADTHERYFVLGGPDDCKMTFHSYVDAVIGSRGLRPFPESAYRKADKNVDATWVYEDYVDTAESQAVLNYQEHSFQDYLDYMAKQAGFTKYILKVISPLIQRQLLKESLTVNKPIQVDSRPLWDVVCERYAIPQQYR
ncbi:MAG: NAD(P)-dependent oxidoreductase [Chloroflexota bacterium]